MALQKQKECHFINHNKKITCFQRHHNNPNVARSIPPPHGDRPRSGAPSGHHHGGRRPQSSRNQQGERSGGGGGGAAGGGGGSRPNHDRYSNSVRGQYCYPPKGVCWDLQQLI